MNADETLLESYCSNCDQWSPDDQWHVHDVYDGDEWIDSSVVCPNCGYGFPEHDPPMRGGDLE